MPTIFLAFANENEKEKHLPTLTEEFVEVNKRLDDRKLKVDFIVHTLPFASTSRIIEDLRKFKKDIIIFLFSGHAGEKKLILDGEEAQSEGIAALLGSCPNLKLVILNGCSTKGQVSMLFEEGIPMIIATSAPVNDFRATQFSITFFEELAVKKNNVKGAFEEAIKTAKVKGSIKEEIVERSLIQRSGQNPSEGLWGLYYSKDKEELITNWRLPEKPQDNKETNEFIKNAIDGIYENFKEDLGEQIESASSQDIILKQLPYSISEPIRKLLAPNDNSGQRFFDCPSEHRYKMLIYSYKSIISFTVFALLAQLWNLKKEKKDKFDTTSINPAIREWLKNDVEKNRTISQLPLLKILINFFEKNKISYFIKEFQSIIEELKGEELQNSISFLENLIETKPQDNLIDLCEETEQHLAVILYFFGFFIYYGLTSIKDINVLYYQHSDAPDFEHKIVKLQQALTQLEDRIETVDTYHKTATIILRQLNDKTNYLYLSPFFIDQNAYTKTPKAMLCSFVTYNHKNKEFHFRHVSKPNELIIIKKQKTSIMAKIKGKNDNNEDYFPLIKDQLSAFCKTVLGITLDEL